MKKLITLLLLCLAIQIQIFAQLSTSDSDSRISLRKGESQLGLSSNLNNGYTLNYRYALKNNLLLRSNLNRPWIAFSSTDNQTNFGLGIGATIGLEKHIPIGNKWSAYYGGELGLGYYRQSNFSSQIANLSGLAGIKYNANERVSFFTEFKYGYTYRRSKSSNNEVLNQISPESSINIGVLFTLGKKKK